MKKKAEKQDRAVYEADGKTVVPYEKQERISCTCGFKGRIGDLNLPDDDDDPIECPQCGTAAWTFA